MVQDTLFPDNPLFDHAMRLGFNNAWNSVVSETQKLNVEAFAWYCNQLLDPTVDNSSLRAQHSSPAAYEPATSSEGGPFESWNAASLLSRMATKEVVINSQSSSVLFEPDSPQQVSSLCELIHVLFQGGDHKVHGVVVLTRVGEVAADSRVEQPVQMPSRPPVVVAAGSASSASTEPEHAADASASTEPEYATAANTAVGRVTHGSLITNTTKRETYRALIESYERLLLSRLTRKRFRSIQTERNAIVSLNMGSGYEWTCAVAEGTIAVLPFLITCCFSVCSYVYMSSIQM